jgi:hypothetical protein
VFPLLASSSPPLQAAEHTLPIWMVLKCKGQSGRPAQSVYSVRSRKLEERRQRGSLRGSLAAGRGFREVMAVFGQSCDWVGSTVTRTAPLVKVAPPLHQRVSKSEPRSIGTTSHGLFDLSSLTQKLSESTSTPSGSQSDWPPSTRVAPQPPPASP